MSFYVEWRYWLVGFGWRTPRQRFVGARFTVFIGPMRFSFGEFGAAQKETAK